METFVKNKYVGLLCAGKVHEAVDYLMQFPRKRALARRIRTRMEEETPVKRCRETFVQQVDAVYQGYYRRIFWQGQSRAEGAETLLMDLLPLAGEPCSESVPGDVTERISQVEARLESKIKAAGYQFLGGLTQGYFGPYIWKNTRPTVYRIELPEGTQTYTVQMMDGFVSRSWLDFVSLGKTGTGGWQTGDDADQVFCVRKAYAMDRLLRRPDFYVSFLKHEAQHAWDKAHHPGLSSAMLEYRAKLVELIHAPDLSKLRHFLAEASGADPENSHSYAAYQIVKALSPLVLGREYETDPAQWRPHLKEVQEYSRRCLAQSLDAAWARGEKGDTP